MITSNLVPADTILRSALVGPHEPVQDGLRWKKETCGERSSQITTLLARSRNTFPSRSSVSLILS